MARFYYQDNFQSMTAARVVITGLGLVCPLGTGVSHCWGKLLSTFPNSLTSLSSPPKEGGEFKDWYPHAVSLENWPHSPKVVGLVARKGMGKFKSNRYFDPPVIFLQNARTLVGVEKSSYI